jgi:hypothetical protein
MTTSENMIDARGPRFGALITTLVLAAVLITESVWLLGFQTIVFLIGATLGPKKSPYGWIYKTFIQKNLKSPLVTEDSKPPQFAQAVGSIFAIVALAGLTLQIDWLFLTATAMALIAAILNAFFNFCLGCQMYLLFKRALNN